MTLIPLLALLAFIFLRPVKIKPGSGGRNTIAGYEVPPDAETEGDNQSAAGRLAHERVEFRLSWLVGLVPAIPFAMLTEAPFAYGAVIVAALGNLIGRKLTNHWDFVGHNIEIMVAESEGHYNYREQEINRMAHGDQRGMTPKQIDQKLRQWEWLARIAKVLA